MTSTPANEAMPSIRADLLEQFALRLSVLAQAAIVLLLTYFRLASGTHFRRKMMQPVPSALD